MSHAFFQFGFDIRELAELVQPLAAAQTDTPVCPNATPSQWAKTALNFEPSAKQTEVLDTDSRFLILCCNRQWGKTTTIAIKAIHHALSLADQSIVIISRTKLQAGILIERAARFLDQLGIRLRRVLGHPFSIKLPNGSRIFAVAHNQDTSAGNTAHVLIIDEAALVKDQVYWSVAPFVGRTKGAIWLLSTPRRPVGFFYNIWHNNDTRWRRVFSSIKDCPDIDPDFLEMQKRADPTKYKQDFECEFVQPPGHLVTREFVRSMLRPKQ